MKERFPFEFQKRPLEPKNRFDIFRQRQELEAVKTGMVEKYRKFKRKSNGKTPELKKLKKDYVCRTTR